MQNMALRIQMDQLADSGLQHAKGLILNPQDIDISSGSWSASGQQLVEGTNDYYDVQVCPDLSDDCNYTIDCNAYHFSNGERTARSNLTAQLRLDPCIALWVGSSTTTTLWSSFTVYGDVYCKDGLVNQGTIDGDVFANTLTGSKTGQKYAIADLSLIWPSVTVADFTSRYSYGTLSGQTFGPYDPPRICYSSSSLTLSGNNVHIEGMLLVSGKLIVSGINNVIIAGKNLPALYVTGDLRVEKGASLQITGLAVVDGDVYIGDNTNLSILGGLFVRQNIIQVQTADDQTANDNKATLYNNPIWQSGGRIGGALQFDGIDDYARTPAPNNSSTKLQLSGDYTISVWVKPNATQKAWAGIVSKTDPTGMDNHWTLQFDNTTPRKLIIYHPSANWYTGITINDLIAGGAWHHIAVVRSSSTMKAYLDGTAYPTGSLENNPKAGNGHLNIGADRTASSSYVYGGLIDDVRIYNRALNASEVSSPPDDPNLLGHWMLDEKAPNVTITAAPTKTAIIVGSGSSTQYWSQAAGAFFRSIRRQ
jgi:hypothetical protein